MWGLCPRVTWPILAYLCPIELVTPHMATANVQPFASGMRSTQHPSLSFPTFNIFSLVEVLNILRQRNVLCKMREHHVQVLEPVGP
jgi:hypothetical protein